MNGERLGAERRCIAVGNVGGRVNLRFNAMALALSVTLAGMAGTTLPTPAQAQTVEAQQSFSIPAGSLRNALDALASQSGITVLYSSELVVGKTTKGLSGRYAPAEALRRLLQSSGLEAQDAGDLTFTLKRASTSKKTTSGNVESSSAEPTQEQPSVTDLERIVVTGTNIRQGDPIGSRVISINRKQIEDSGYGRIQDYLETLPQNFSGASEDFNQNSNYNYNRGHEIQLRGLGTGTTLVLLNGQRVASGGLEGLLVDISSIPMAAVERIEILTDGASAVYGSDAIGGVVNIILRRDYSGAESRVRFATASGDRNEQQISQVFGGSTDSAAYLVGVELSKMNPLWAKDRRISALNYDYTSYGGTDFREFYGYYHGNPGTIYSPSFGVGYGIPASQNGRNLSVSDLISGTANYADYVTNVTSLPEQKMQSAFVNLSKNLRSGAQLTFDARYAKRKVRSVTGPTTAVAIVTPSNPFYVNPYPGTGFVAVAYDFTDDLGVPWQVGEVTTYSGSIGLNLPLGETWNLRGAANYGREDNSWDRRNLLNSSALAAALADTDPNTAFNVFGDGSNTNPETIDGVRQNIRTSGKTEVRSVNAVADGVIAILPGGELKLALGVDLRSEQLSVVTNAAPEVRTSRDVRAIFGELSVPLIGTSDEIAAYRLEASVSGRWEDYSDFGKTFDPRFGLTWRVSPAIKVRANWGTSFRAPSFSQSSEALHPSQAYSATVPDPTSPTGSSKAIFRYGSNANLKPETADTWSVGTDFRLPFDTPINVSIGYYNIDYRNKIGAIEGAFTALTREAELSPVITRNPSQGELDAICNSPSFISGDCTGTISAIVDQRQRNIAVVETSGIDLEVSSRADFVFGSLTSHIGATYVTHFKRAVTTTSPLNDVVDTVGMPLALRIRAGLGWSSGAWGAGIIANYSGSYNNTGTIPSERVGSFTSIDANLAYEFLTEQSFLKGARFSLAVNNLLDKEPNFVDVFGGYDSANGSLLGRVVSLQVTKEW